jgi:uncharacterized protein YbcC (UPF0753/DUF2309 family)
METINHHKINEIIEEIRHFLPAQSPLKDFVHHNTLHAFQKEEFFDSMAFSRQQFGYASLMELSKFREKYHNKAISDEELNRIIVKEKGEAERELWKNKMLHETTAQLINPKVGKLRQNWINSINIEVNDYIHPQLFRLLSNYLDQGISIWNFPIHHKGFLTSLRALEKNSFSSFFRTKKVKNLFIQNRYSIEKLLKWLVGDEKYFESYLFDQQFTHPGWSGLVANIENDPTSLLDSKLIRLEDLIVLELLLELDLMYYKFGENWKTVSTYVQDSFEPLFIKVEKNNYDEVMKLWQLAFEWTHYNDVLKGISDNISLQKTITQPSKNSFQALFCIDDRECSLRRYLEMEDTNCLTFGTPGFFNIDAYFKPQHANFVTKICPAPMNPNYVIEEVAENKTKEKKALNFESDSHKIVKGWLLSQTLGFLSAIKLSKNIISPSPDTSLMFSAKSHMVNKSALHFHRIKNEKAHDGFLYGYSIDEMVERSYNLLMSIGLVKDFAPIVYVIGHGSSSVNNPYFAAYGCGACSGRPGSVNARVLCAMVNMPEVRAQLAEKGIIIPNEVYFLPGLHDTSTDEIEFYDEELLKNQQLTMHVNNQITFSKALDMNAKERSRRFESIDSKLPASVIHKQVKKRIASLFEPRPELNHATNSLCIIGRRSVNKNLFLDRRSFLNSYDYSIDREGVQLKSILGAATPVCAGINLEYFFSATDPNRLGAGSKLPQNIIGLIGLANGIDGDLRPGLPTQMTEVHDPLRLLMIVEHFPEVVLNVIQSMTATYGWFEKNWVNLVVIHPETDQFYRFQNGTFSPIELTSQTTHSVSNLNEIVENETNNSPVFMIKNKAL